MNKNVIEVEAEEISFETELQDKISKELVKRNVTDAVISQLKSEFSGLKLKSKTDKESYLQLKEGRLTVRKVEILGEKAFKKLKEYPNQVRNYILDKEKEFANKFSAIYPNLDEGIKTFEDEQERVEQEESKRKEAAYQQRQATLIKYGATYNNGSFELNHISYEIDNIREADEEIWNDIILPKYKAEFEKVEADRVRQEKEREEAALKLKQEQEELNRQREEMDKQRKELADAQAAMQKMRDEAERDKERISSEERHKKVVEEEKLWRSRLSELKDVTLENDKAMYWNEVVLTQSELLNLSEESFNIVRDAHNKSVEQRKKAIEEKRISDAEEQRKKDIEDALQKERDRVAEQKRQDDIKAERDRQEKLEALAKAGDKAKWAIFIEALETISIPEMKSDKYRNKVSIVKEKIEEIYSL